MNLSYEDIFALLTVLIGTLSLIPYYIGVIRHKVKPHVFTWVTWTLVNSIVAAVQFSEHGGVGAWTTAIAAAQLAGVALLSMCGYGSKNITRSDKISFALALLVIPLWQWTHQPLWSVILLCFIDGMAFYPTFRKSWLEPFQEKICTYAIGNLRCVLSLFALESFTWASALFPLWIIALDTVFIALLLARRKALKGSILPQPVL